MKTFECVVTGKWRAFSRWVQTTPLAIVVLFITVANSAPAQSQVQTIPILTYDVEQTPQSGFGCWSHSYTGTITLTSRTISGSVNCTPTGTVFVANYSGSGGTLNDGQISTNLDGTQLFTTRNADDGLPISPLITLHFGGLFLINDIQLFGGDVISNAIPGALTGATVEIGSTLSKVVSIPFGTPNGLGVPVNDSLDLSGTPLATIPTDQIVLHDFTAALFDFSFDQFSITEIVVHGSPAALPVAIDVRPFNERNRIQSPSHGLIPVAVLSDAQFDAPALVNGNSLRFGRTGDEASLAFCEQRPHDVNRDQRPDLVCWFKTELMGFRTGDTTANLKGQTTTGQPFVGHDQVCVDCRSGH